jgi:DNA-binding MarR family transcriptional regulator
MNKRALTVIEIEANRVPALQPIPSTLISPDERREPVSLDGGDYLSKPETRRSAALCWFIDTLALAGAAMAGVYVSDWHDPPNVTTVLNDRRKQSMLCLPHCYVIHCLKGAVGGAYQIAPLLRRAAMRSVDQPGGRLRAWPNRSCSCSCIETGRTKRPSAVCRNKPRPRSGRRGPGMIPRADDPNTIVRLLQLHRTARLARGGYDGASLAQLPGMTCARCAVLIHLAQHKVFNQAALAQILDIRPTTLVRLLDWLEAAGFVARMPDPDDRRAHILALISWRSQPRPCRSSRVSMT